MTQSISGKTSIHIQVCQAVKTSVYHFLIIIRLLTGGNTKYTKAHVLEKRKKIIRFLRQSRNTENNVLTTIYHAEFAVFKQPEGRPL